MNTISFNTTQNVQIDSDKAGVGHRFIAVLLDYLFLSAFFCIVFLFIGGANIENIALYWSISTSIMFFFYHFIMEAFFNAQSFGKRIMKIRVVKVNGEEAELIQHLGRAIFRPIDNIIGIYPMIFSKHGKRFGDMVSGTLVVKVEESVDFDSLILTQIEENYQPIYTNAQISKLKGSDIELLKRIVAEANAKHDYRAVKKATLKM